MSKIKPDGYAGFKFLSGLDPFSFTTDPDSMKDGKVPVSLLETKELEEYLEFLRVVRDFCTGSNSLGDRIIKYNAEALITRLEEGRTE